MASSFPTPPPSHIENKIDKSAAFKEMFEKKATPWEKECERRRSELDPELLGTAKVLVDRVLAKVVADQCLRLATGDELSQVKGVWGN